MKRNGIIVCCSGGMDSFLVAKLAQNEFEKVLMFHIDYGQCTATREAIEVSNQAKDLRVEIFKVEVNFRSLYVSSLINTNNIQEKEKTYVPFRNTTFASIAAGIAEEHNYDAVGLGIHYDEDYSDTNSEYAEALDKLIKKASKYQVTLFAPIVTYEKHTIIKECNYYNLDLSYTWSCYFSNLNPCKECTSCKKRAEAFETLRMKDPLLYGRRS